MNDTNLGRGKRLLGCDALINRRMANLGDPLLERGEIREAGFRRDEAQHTQQGYRFPVFVSEIP